MDKKTLQNIIDDVLQSYKYPDGTLKDEHEIIAKYTEKWEEKLKDKICACEEDYQNDLFHYISSETKTIYEVIKKYIGKGKDINIKARKGKIVIEES